MSNVKKTGTFFIANEVEVTPVYNKRTLFVTGVQTTIDILTLVDRENCSHVYLGADESCTKETLPLLLALAKDLIDNWAGYVTLDYFISDHEVFVKNIPDELVNSTKFIAMVSVRMPNITKMPNNTVIKLCDSGFNTTNRGVWCTNLAALTEESGFTPWEAYAGDKKVSL